MDCEGVERVATLARLERMLGPARVLQRQYRFFERIFPVHESKTGGRPPDCIDRIRVAIREIKQEGRTPRPMEVARYTYAPRGCDGYDDQRRAHDAYKKCLARNDYTLDELIREA